MTLRPPSQGVKYEIKVNFLKAETAAELIDIYFDSLGEAAREEGRDSGWAGWNAIREGLTYVNSEAEFEVFDADGESIGKAETLESQRI